MGLMRQDSFPHPISHCSHLPDPLEAGSAGGDCGVIYVFKGVKAFACVLHLFSISKVLVLLPVF